MKRITVRVPVRADLAGGTLDLWPLYLFHPGARTVNVAISYFAECSIGQTQDSTIRVHLTDSDYRAEYESPKKMAEDPKVSLISKAIEHFGLYGLEIITRTDAPRGSGLGGSSALSIALVRAMSEVAGAPVEGVELIELVRDLETRLLAVPAGIQDYYPPVFGGLASLHLEPGKIQRHQLSLPVTQLAEHFVLHYSGVAHFSGTNNWEIYKRHIDGDTEVQQRLREIATISNEMERALEARDLEAAGAALHREWETRKRLVQGITTPELDEAIDAATAAGAWGGKVCGAGGGGCLIFLTPAGKREEVVRALRKVTGRTVDAAPVAHGLVIERSDDTQASFTFATRRIRPRDGEEGLEQLYLVTDRDGRYRPNVFAQANIRYEESRSGLRHSVTKSFVVPLPDSGDRIDWRDASEVADPESLRFVAVPDPRRAQPATDVTNEAVAVARSAEENFRYFIRDVDRFVLYQNPSLSLYSQPGESREAFLARCLDHAQRDFEKESERLEGTFRRRFDQMREKSEREQRENEAIEEATPDVRRPEVAISWGQTLYNITSGRPATTEAPQSVSEADYLERIAQIQKQWERELESVKEELQSRANQVEEIVLSPSFRNIETVKYLLLWAPAGAIPPR
jgi:D-glycero-alpha-D-manno-heptose-7-phosphate kinase